MAWDILFSVFLMLVFKFPSKRNFPMKSKIYLSLVFIIILSSCDFLNVVPDNVATVDNAFSDRTRAEQYLHTVYSYLDGDWTYTNPGYMSDEYWTNPRATLVRPARFEMLTAGKHSVSNPYLDYWSGGQGVASEEMPWNAIRDCNIFLDNIDNVPGVSQFEKVRWIAEVKFLKAYYHFKLFRMYGPIPLVDEVIPVSTQAGEAGLYREPVDEVVDYIVSLIDEAMLDLPATIVDRGSELGRITKSIAAGIKAKVLVTAASPLFNGNDAYQGMVDSRGTQFQLFNPEYDPEKWEIAAEAAKAAIGTAHQAGHRLYQMSDLPLASSAEISDSTKQLLLPNAVVSDRWNSEVIWGLAPDNPRLRSLWSIAPLHPDHQIRIDALRTPPLKMLEMFYSENGVPIDEDVTYDYENRYSLVEISDNDEYYLQPGEMTARLQVDREPRFYGSIGMDNGWWYGLGRLDDEAQWPINAKLGELSNESDKRSNSFTGTWQKKHHSFQDTWESGNNNLIAYGWGVPLLRLADLYLLYAEALNESLDAPNSEVYQYVDMIRERAGLEGVVDSWNNYSSNPQKPQTKEGMREIIQRERSIELAFEMQRWWDLVRWGRAIEEMNKPVTGWNVEGETAEEFYQVRVLNQEETPFTRKYIFWPIEQEELSRNPNLIQNLGW